MKRGFTLIELLVVIAIIALVGTFAAVAVNSARSKQRDATRLSQVRQLQSGLEDFFNERNTYPAGDRLALGDAALSACLSVDGFDGSCDGGRKVLMRIITPTFEDGLKGLVTCGTPARNAFCYSQTLDGAGYRIEFELERGVAEAGLAKGVNCATPDGMEAGACK